MSLAAGATHKLSAVVRTASRCLTCAVAHLIDKVRGGAGGGSLREAAAGCPPKSASPPFAVSRKSCTPPSSAPLPYLQVARFLRHLLETRFKDASNPVGALDNVRKALGHLRSVQRGIPNAHDFTK